MNSAGALLVYSFSSQFSVPFFNTGSFTLGALNANFGTTFTAGGSASGLFTFTATNSGITGAVVFAAPYILNGATLLPLITNTYRNAADAPFEATAPLTILGNVSASGLSIDAGLNGSGTLTGGGNIWKGGAISNTTIIVSGAFTNANTGELPPGNPPTQFQILAGGSKSLDAASITVTPGAFLAWISASGTASQTDSLQLLGGSQIINHGSLSDFLYQSFISAGDSNPNNQIINQGDFARNSFTLGIGNDTSTVGVPFQNSGTVTSNQGAIEFDAGFTQTAGLLSGSGGSITGGNLSLLGGAIAGNIFAPITISNTVALAEATRLNSVPTFAASSPTLDVMNNALALEATDPTDKATKIAALQMAVQSGQSGGSWTGDGITSSTLAADAAAGTNNSFHTTLAIVDNGAYPPNTGFTVFAGEPVDANSIILVRALVGDANLDGTVNNTDLVALLTHYNETGQTQATGDYNGDGSVNNTDLVALLTDFGQSLPGGYSIQPEVAIGPALAQSAPVPEPGSLLLIAGAMVWTLRPRRPRPPAKRRTSGR